MRLKYNAPVVLTTTAVCTALWLADAASGGAVVQATALLPEWNSRLFFTAFTYALAHANAAHLFGNLGLMLLVAPAVEERLGTWRYLGATAAVVVITALLHLWLFSDALIGLSGVVCMNIVLASFTNVRRGEVPLTFVLVAIFYFGGEVLRAFDDDHISQFAHLLGGAIGAVFALLGLGLRADKPDGS